MPPACFLVFTPGSLISIALGMGLSADRLSSSVDSASDSELLSDWLSSFSSMCFSECCL